MEDHIPKRLDRSLILGRQTLWDVVFHENKYFIFRGIFMEDHRAVWPTHR